MCDTMVQRWNICYKAGYQYFLLLGLQISFDLNKWVLIMLFKGNLQLSGQYARRYCPFFI
jgi:hypothetical protein